MKPFRVSLGIVVISALTAIVARGDGETYLRCKLCGGAYNIIQCTDTPTCSCCGAEAGDCTYCASCTWCDQTGRICKTKIFSCSFACQLGPAARAAMGGRRHGTLILASYRGNAGEPQSSPQVSVRVSVPSDVPVRVVVTQAEPSPVGLNSLRYYVENAGRIPVRALVVRWQFYFGGNPGPVAHTIIDRWGQAPVAPHERVDDTFGPIGADPAQSVSQAVGEVAYVEFTDGTQAGTERQEMSRWLARQRLALRNAYRVLFEAYRTGGRSGLHRALEQPTSSRDQAARSARHFLLTALEHEDLSAAMQEVEQMSELPIPGQP